LQFGAVIFAGNDGSAETAAEYYSSELYLWV